MSHEEQTDMRIRRTHHFLQEAMIELVTEKGFDAITVGDIAERAMINRATFYRHYQDKYDLMAKIFEETTTQLVENMKPFRKDTRQSEMENPPEIWIQFFEHIAEYARLYRAMLGKRNLLPHTNTSPLDGGWWTNSQHLIRTGALFPPGQ
jgi:AcrR family transcriptional regulator